MRDEHRPVKRRMRFNPLELFQFPLRQGVTKSQFRWA